MDPFSIALKTTGIMNLSRLRYLKDSDELNLYSRKPVGGLKARTREPIAIGKDSEWASTLVPCA